MTETPQIVFTAAGVESSLRASLEANNPFLVMENVFTEGRAVFLPEIDPTLLEYAALICARRSREGLIALAKTCSHRSDKLEIIRRGALSGGMWIKDSSEMPTIATFLDRRSHAIVVEVTNPWHNFHSVKVSAGCKAGKPLSKVVRWAEKPATINNRNADFYVLAATEGVIALAENALTPKRRAKLIGELRYVSDSLFVPGKYRMPEALGQRAQALLETSL